MKRQKTDSFDPPETRWTKVDNGNGGDLQPYEPPRKRHKLTTERLTQFLALYIEHDFNAVDAAIALGMSPESAHSHAHDYVRAIRHNVTIQQAFRRVGLVPMRVADKLNKLMDAKEPKWNQKTEQWDHFENTRAQLEAIKQVARLMNLYPAEPKDGDGQTVNVIIDVKP
jgi:hypothetical protein